MRACDELAHAALAPGETKTVTLTLDQSALAFWDDGKHAWVAEAGAFEALIGSSSQDIHARAEFQLTKTAVFGGPAKAPVALSVDQPVKQLLEDERARAIMEARLPGFADNAGMAATMGMSLSQMAAFAPEQITPERLAAIAADFAALG